MTRSAFTETYLCFGSTYEHPGSACRSTARSAAAKGSIINDRQPLCTAGHRLVEPSVHKLHINLQI
jgi:hypothetical protein